MTTPIPAGGYPSNATRVNSDMQTYLETMLSICKEQIGGTGEATSVQLSSNTFTPGNNSCVCPLDTNGMGPSDTLNTIQTTNIRDGEVIFIRSTNNGRVITIANNAGGSGQIYTGDGNSITMNNTKLFVALKYNAAISAWEELFRTFGSSGGFTNPMTTLGDTLYGAAGGAATRLAGNTTTTRNFLRQTGTGSASASPAWDVIQSGDIPWATPGAIGSGTAAAGTFTTLTLTGSVSAGTIFGNFSGSSAAPAFQSPGSADQILGVKHTGGGLEYKSIVAGSNITITPAAGSITIAATSSGGVTSVGMTGDGTVFNTTVSGSPITTSGTLAPSLKSQSALTILGGPNSVGASAAAPTFTNFDDVATMNGASGIRPLLCSVPGAPTITQGGTSGSTHYTYSVAAVMSDGVDYTAASATTQTTTGNATLTSTNKNNIAWSAVTGAATYQIWRTASSGSPSSTGYIGSTSSTSFSDTGIAATAGPLTGQTATAPSQGYMRGDHWHNGNWTLPCPVNTDSFRARVSGTVTIASTWTINTELAGGIAYTGATGAGNFVGGSNGAGLGGGQGGGGVAISGSSGSTFGGGGGGHGGAGGYPNGVGLPQQGLTYPISVVLAGSGGGAGAAVNNNNGGNGGAGGGSFLLLATGAVSFNSGAAMTATGIAGSASTGVAGGGGSGGGIQIRSLSTVTVNSGASITAAGGAGGACAGGESAGGGGGGGIIDLSGSTVANSGTISASGGAAGAASGGAFTASAGSAGVVNLNSFLQGPRSAN